MSKYHMRFMVMKVAAFALVSCFACSAGQNNSPAVNSDIQNPGKQTMETVMPMNPAAQIDFSKRDLAFRLDLETDEVEVSASRPVAWRSGAVGCPKPGVAYTDALVPGILIELRVGKATYRYHARRGGQPFYCPDERAESPAPGAGLD